MSKVVLLALLGLLSTPSAIAQDTLKISLEQALDIAMSESPTVKIANKEILKKGYARKETIGQLFPNISASASYSYTIKKQRFAMGGQSIEVGTSNNVNGGLNLALPIFAPTLYKSIQLTAKDVELAVEASRASKLDLVNQIQKAYYQLLLAQDSYEVFKQSYKQAEDTYEVVNNKYIQGAVSEYDKIRAEVQVRNLKPSVISAENAVNLTKMQLKVLMGIDSNLPIAIHGNLANYEESMYAEVMRVDTTSLNNNSDLKQLDLQQEMLKKTLQLNKTAYMPTLSLSSQISWVAMNESLKFKDYAWNPYSTVGLSLSIPIFAGGTRYHKVKQTKMQMEQMELTRLNTRRNIDMMVTNYVDNMNKSVEQVGSNKEGVKQAQKGCNIAQKRYEVGTGTILELNDSELTLTQSKLTYNQSIFDFLSSKVDLDKALGKDRVTTNEQQPR